MKECIQCVWRVSSRLTYLEFRGHRNGPKKNKFKGIVWGQTVENIELRLHVEWIIYYSFNNFIEDLPFLRQSPSN